MILHGYMAQLALENQAPISIVARFIKIWWRWDKMRQAQPYCIPGTNVICASVRQKSEGVVHHQKAHYY